MTTEEDKKSPFRPSKATMAIVREVEEALRDNDFKPVGGVVPLLHDISVVAEQDGKIYNVRVSKKNYEITSVDELDYKHLKDGTIRRIYRNRV